MKSLYLILSDYGYPGLERFLQDVRLAGIEIIPYAAAGSRLIRGDDNVKDIADRDKKLKGSYLLTDCMQGVDYASETGMGYVFYEPDGSEDTVTESDGNMGSTAEEHKGTDAAECITRGFDEIGADFIIKMYQRHNHLPWTILTTKRLKLREMTVEDVDRLYEIYSEPSITRYTESLYEDRDEEIEYTKAYIRNQYEFFGYGLWIVEKIETGRMIGRAGITNREGWEEAEIGYIIEKESQNRGYATEICRAIVEYARDVLIMPGLNCFVQPENEVSVRICRRLGFDHIEDVDITGIRMSRYHIDLRK